MMPLAFKPHIQVVTINDMCAWKTWKRSGRSKVYMIFIYIDDIEIGIHIDPDTDGENCMRDSQLVEMQEVQKR
jgi:hypothetical protein